MARKWTAEEDALLCAEYNRIPIERLAEKLGRTECAVRARALCYQPGLPVIEFDCAHCGRHVVTEGKRANGRNDQRTRFCCTECEKKYWRHPPHEHKSASQTFQSLRQLQAHEERTNRS